MTTEERLKAIAENETKAIEANEKLDLCLKGNKVDAKSWYDEFWDSINTQNYSGVPYIFAGEAWNDTTFRPKRDIILRGNSVSAFANNFCSNIKKRLQEQNVRLDLSDVTNLGQGFYYSRTTELPELDLSNCSTIGAILAYSKTKIIDKVTFKDGIAFPNNTFLNCIDLMEIRIGGTISGSGFDIHWSTNLSADSLKSIITALSTTTTGLTITLPTTAQDNYEAVYGAGSWEALTASRSNWTIAYA